MHYLGFGSKNTDQKKQGYRLKVESKKNINNKPFAIWIQFLIAIFFGFLVVYIYSKITGNQNNNQFWPIQDLKKFFIVVVLYPIIEEMSFRGVIQSYFSSYTYFRNDCCGITIANILTSFLFVAIHFVYHAPLWALLVFVPSLVFGYFRDQSNSVVPSIILHILYNWFYFSIIM